MAQEMELTLSKKLVPELARQIDRVVKEIEHCEVFYQTKEKLQTPPLDPEPLNRLIQKLTKALERKRPALVNPVLEELESHELPDEEQQVLAQVHKWVKKYKFKEALAALRSLTNPA